VTGVFRIRWVRTAAQPDTQGGDPLKRHIIMSLKTPYTLPGIPLPLLPGKIPSLNFFSFDFRLRMIPLKPL
jgi:hypothetical protein